MKEIKIKNQKITGILGITCCYYFKKINIMSFTFTIICTFVGNKKTTTTFNSKNIIEYVF